jgi:Recombinase
VIYSFRTIPNLSLRAIADALNGEGSTTRTGASWSAAQVKRVLDRAA